MRRLYSLPAALLWLGCSSFPALAGSAYHGLGDEVPGAAGRTYADVLGATLGTISEESGGWTLELKDDLRDIDPDNDSEAFPNEIALTGVETEVLPGSDGRLAVLADSGDFFAVLAVFDLKDKGHPLVDAAAVTYDRLNGLGDMLDLSGGAAAIRVTSSHLNAGQSYAIDSLIMLSEGHLSLIDSILTLSDMGCGYQRQQTPELAAIEAPDRAHADIAAVVTETVTATGESCDDSQDLPPPSTRRIAVTYRWDGKTKQYVADSDALDRLQAETEERF